MKLPSVQQLLDHRNSGESYAQIGTRYGVSDATIWRALNHPSSSTKQTKKDPHRVVKFEYETPRPVVKRDLSKGFPGSYRHDLYNLIRFSALQDPDEFDMAKLSLQAKHHVSVGGAKSVMSDQAYADSNESYHGDNKPRKP